MEMQTRQAKRRKVVTEEEKDEESGFMEHQENHEDDDIIIQENDGVEITAATKNARQSNNKPSGDEEQHGRLSKPFHPFLMIQNMDACKGDNLQKPQFVCVHIQQPRSNDLHRYIIQNEHCFELRCAHDHTFKDEMRSAFAGNYVFEDGGVFVATRFDILFFVIGLLREARRKSAEHDGYFLPSGSIFNTPLRFPSNYFQPDTLHRLLSRVCDVKDGYNDRVYRLNDEMLMNILRKKVDQLMVVLKSCPSIHLHLNQDNPLDDAAKKKLLRNSLAILSDYLAQGSLELLCKSYDISVNELAPQKTEKKSAFALDVVDADMPAATAKPSAAVPAPSAKKKTTSQKKIDTTGMRGIGSYFAK